VLEYTQLNWKVICIQYPVDGEVDFFIGKVANVLSGIAFDPW